MANRLAKVLDQLVQGNQSAFIKGRSIHDNFRDVQLSCKELHRRRSTCVLLKIDVAKAFDSVAWVFLLEVLQRMGFGLRWRNWISAILSTSSTKILLNGRPGRRICHSRGLRQGDPLSPMLFVLVMEVLNHLLGWVERQGLLTPIAELHGSRVSLYADDLVMFVVPNEQDLLTVKAVLGIFGLASGLFSNLDKSIATPIHCSEDDIARVQGVLSCTVQIFPCKYLGIPLSVYKLKRSEEQYIIDKVAQRIPGWKGNLLNVAGRTALVKATLSAIPIHTSIALCLSPWAIGMIDKLRRAFVWAGTDKVAGGLCKVAWGRVCLPKELGGLDISDLRRVGIALRVRWVWHDRRLGRRPATKEKVALALFQAATVLNLGNGRSTYFWTDKWIRGVNIESFAPTVFAAVRARNKMATVAEALDGSAWVRHIAAPPSLQLLLEIDLICDLIDDVQLSQEPDTFTWRLTADRSYSAASAYGAMFLGSSPVLGAKQIWKTPAPPKVRFFFWLTMHGRCWTGDRRFRHGLQPSNDCIMCDQEPETMDHILIGCSFSREVWHIWFARIWLQVPSADDGEAALEWWLRSRKTVQKSLRRGFDSLIFLVGWMLWKERNSRTFNAVASTPGLLVLAMQEEAERWCSAGNRCLGLILARL